MSFRSKPTSTAASKPTTGSRLAHVITVGSTNLQASNAKLVSGAMPPMRVPNAPQQAVGVIGAREMARPVTITPDQKFKSNTGTVEQWSNISYEVVQLPEAHPKQFYDRKGTMIMLENALQPEVHRDMGPLVMSEVHRDMSPLVMRAPNQVPSAFYAHVDSPARLEESGMGPNVVLVKMWGFAAMHDAEDMISHYANGVEALFAMPSFVGSLNAGAHVVLHFDGDAAYEKKDDKFSHNLFAAFVAKQIKDKAGGKVPVHLVITKVDTLDAKKGETLLTMVGKFCNSDSGFKYYNFRTEPTAGAHAYPYFDRRFFDSGALYVSEPGPIKSTGSEGQNSQMMEELFKGRVMARFCLGIGGNTMGKNPKTGIESGGGVMSVKQFIMIEGGRAFPFNGAVRVDVYVTMSASAATP